jgi:hypothetical protein
MDLWDHLHWGAAEMTIKFQLFDVKTRRLAAAWKEAGNIKGVDLQVQDEPDLGWVFGTWDHTTHAVDPDGNVVPITNPAQPWLGAVPEIRNDPLPPPTKAQVNEEAQRRILERYPVLDQLTVLRKGGAGLATMGAYIDGVIDASNTLTAKGEIKQDYQDDKHWPAPPAASNSQTASLKGKSP